MSKFLSQKRKLLEEVFQKASNEATEKTFTGILKSLERDLLDDFKITLSYKSFETYYKAIVENDGDYNIKPAILDDLSVYLGYDNFRSFCMDWKTIEYTISQTLSKIVINITNKPIFTMPEFIKQNGLGILEVTFILLLVAGGVVFPKTTGEPGSTDPAMFTFFGKADIGKRYMYWNGEKYIATDNQNVGPEFKVVAMNAEQFKYFKKITRKDTMTIENSLGRTWYSKYNGDVDFFTADGIDPETGKELRKSSELILTKYAGANANTIQTQ
ncbi:hypothetical protein [Chryseobacterium gossypii]|uniref:hypothetical protein n=1 Tax=Chryseobacterium gossypii TaxID=3231602 RepID=UPI00352592C8